MSSAPFAQVLSLWSVTSREQVFRLARPLEVTVTAGADVVTCRNDALHLTSTGPTLGHALAALGQDFAVLYARLVEADGQLSPEGERLAQSLCAWVRSRDERVAPGR